MYLFTIKSQNMLNLLIDKKESTRLLISATAKKNFSDTESTHLTLIGWNQCSQCCCEPSGCC
jgi:hypothetical protein